MYKIYTLQRGIVQYREHSQCFIIEYKHKISNHKFITLETKILIVWHDNKSKN